MRYSHNDDSPQVNVVGTLILFQASFPLLKSSSSHPKFVVISARGGSITTPLAIPIVPYQTSKAAVNFLSRKLHFEHEDDGLGTPVVLHQSSGRPLITLAPVIFPICPGLVKTDMSE
jgi:NAD(P)-dependent dehydrogenase (short-subunit alcohol dehydrogenase family)